MDVRLPLRSCPRLPRFYLYPAVLLVNKAAVLGCFFRPAVQRKVQQQGENNDADRRLFKTPDGHV
jgi:hypothetical protein